MVPPTILRRVLDRVNGDDELFLTHTLGDWCAPGQRWADRDGNVHRITRVKPERPTALLGGGRASCWQVRGVPDRPTWEDHIVKAIDALGVLPYIERLAGWLARRLPSGDGNQ